jgi:hypothetical protein
MVSGIRTKALAVNRGCSAVQDGGLLSHDLKPGPQAMAKLVQSAWLPTGEISPVAGRPRRMNHHRMRSM